VDISKRSRVGFNRCFNLLMESINGFIKRFENTSGMPYLLPRFVRV
jgi:hypothetical protein